MVLKLKASSVTPPLGGLLTAKFVESVVDIELEWGKESSIQITPTSHIDSNVGMARYLARLGPQLKMYGNDILEQTEIDHWLSFAIGPLTCSQEFETSLQYLDQALGPVTYLVGNHLTIADLVIWGTLFGNQSWAKMREDKTAQRNVSRWFDHLKELKEVSLLLSILPKDFTAKLKKEEKVTEFKDEGKFVELPDAKVGEVVVRFPPEASGYLHIGHAKAALLNQYYQEAFKGKLIMRFDDTNPDKEKVDFEKVILEDLKLLQIFPDQFTHTSDHFDLMLGLCEKMLKEGKAYVDDTDPETMKQEREQRTPSKNRENTVDKNLHMWLEMVNGSAFGQKCCVRAKIDMASDNGCMRDPTIYRCKNEPHPKTGTKYKVYPTYDFACPIVDSIEGVTHSLRTMEYRDRDEQFYWFINALNLRKPFIWEFARLNMMNTVLSKRKLTWFVNEKIVDSWDDPRFPTVRGMLRRGMTVEGLKQFIIAQGSSRSVVQMEWDKIWAFNKKVIDPVAPRYTALEEGKTVVVNVADAKVETLTIPKHPKNADIGFKKIRTSPKVLIDAADAALIRENENVTFINWGNIKINKVNRNSDGTVSSIDAETNLSNVDYKKTLKLTWLGVVPDEPSYVPFKIEFYDHIITKPVLAKDEDFQSYVNKDSKKVVNYVGDTELAALKMGDIIQLQRIGYFRCDVPQGDKTSLVLIHIPDGSTKTVAAASKTVESAKKQSTKKEGSPSTVASAKNIVTNEELESIAQEWMQDKKALTDEGNTNEKKAKDKKVKDKNVDEKKVKENNVEEKKVKEKKGKEKNVNEKKTEEKKDANPKKQTKNKPKASDKPVKADDGNKKQARTRLGIEVLKEENLPEWYSQVITKGELIEYYEVSGCYILRPWAYGIWEFIQSYIDKKIKSLGVQNCYFPLFVSRSVLEREKTHVADFAPEVAWVTKSGDSDLAEPIAIRPTSETVMYPAYAKWIQSYRDLPIKLNQWNNVVRWEFKHPQPFIRTREFLWQEGHTAFAGLEEAKEEVYQILDIYSNVYTDLLAIPVMKGLKTNKEKFAGGDFTTTIEAFIPATGRGIQAATSHHLGQNFSKMFDIVYEDPTTQEKKFVFQNSWGITTRTIGVMILVHADNQGLILPPRVASLQAVIVPCGIVAGLKEETRLNLINRCQTLESDFKQAEVRVKLDDRDNYSPGWKFNHWELKGVPIRVELGPKDLEKNQFVAVRRDTGEKKILPLNNAVQSIKDLLEAIQKNLLEKATAEFKNHTVTCKSWNEFCTALDSKNVILAPFCEEIPCEDNIKRDSARDQDLDPGAPAMGAKSLCIPFDQPTPISNNDTCIHPDCKRKPVRYTLFGRSY